MAEKDALEEFDRSTVYLSPKSEATPHPQLVWRTAEQVYETRDLHGEVRCRRDLR